MAALSGAVFVNSPARAQAAPQPSDDQSATQSAEDAFGATAGINQVGLYSPYSTRGFDLIATGGAFRIDGFFFHPINLPSESLVSGSSINVGLAATALDLPSPTGVVAYQLREPGERSALSVTAGTRGYGAPSVETLGSLVSDDGTFGLVAHSFLSPNERWANGQDGSRVDMAAVASWKPNATTRIRLFGDHSRQAYDGDTAFLPVGDGVPPALKPRRNYGVDWARVRSRSSTAGILAEHGSGGWRLGASAIRSVRSTPHADTTLLEIDRTGTAVSTLFHTPRSRARSDSFELKAGRSFSLAGLNHRIALAARARSTLTLRPDSIAVPSGTFALRGRPADVPEADLPSRAPAARDQVRQRLLSVSYDLAADAVQLRLGAHRTRYAKSYRPVGGAESHNVEQSWLYSASTLWRPLPKLSLFASYVSGLEESGVAPDLAANRGAVLPPVEARQYEVGARIDLTTSLALIVAGFDIRKPIYGLRSDLLYAPVGTVRHRGVEASLTGQVTPTTRVVLGANVLQLRVSGALVEAGAINRVAPGVSRFNGTVAIEQKLTDRWSVDGYLLHEGGRRRDSQSKVEVDGVPFAIVGTTYGWKLGRLNQSLRVQRVNAFQRKGYYATPYGALAPISGAHWRVLITTNS
ncbi:TonB-dependent receptor [Sphingomonas piscis]|uniref:TonB-dependent receptor n=1 Tax=Sphingomonas piscis TaxID=2714943 RepID=A0A6G7YPG3_9SPHN|nr:TonB-dependent receptor [Sphingomonas piscis]QIK78629.1 TonB-dependent receptor [Sphingomonas piscis]